MLYLSGHKKINTVLIVLLIGCILITGCGKKKSANMNSGAGKGPSQSGVLNLASYRPDTLNPLASKYSCVRDFLYLAYEGLFVVNEDLTVRNVLASDYKISEDNTVFRIELKKGVKFHDGSAFTSADVIETFEYIRSYDNYYSGILSNVQSYGADGDYAVQVNLKSPQANFLCNLDFPILPSGLGESAFKSPNGSFSINGTGRYKYRETKPNVSIILEKNPSWHGTSKVYIPEVCIRFVKDNDGILYAFDSGETDLITTDRARWGEFSYSNDFDTYEVTSTRYVFIGMNTTDSVFSDPEFRKQFAALIDKAFITETTLFSHAETAENPITSKAYFYRNTDEVKFEPDKDYFSPHDNKAELYLLYNEESMHKEEIAQYIKETAESAGLEIIMSKVDYKTYCKKVASGDYHIYIGEVDLKRDCDLGFMFKPAPVLDAQQYDGDDMVVKVDEGDAVVAPDSPDNKENPDGNGEANKGKDNEQKNGRAVPSSMNICDFTNANLDDIINNINSAKDPEALMVAYNNLCVFYDENVPQLPICHLNEAMFVNKRIKGKINPNLTNFYADLGEIYIDVK